MKFYSEYGEDKWLYDHGLLNPHGIFVDVGCAHPEHGSNTALLRDLGWTGIAIDGNPDYRPAWEPKKSTTDFIASVAADAGKTRFWIDPDPSLSRAMTEGEYQDAIRRKIPGKLCEVRCAALGTILAEQHVYRIDLLSLDVEGDELEVFLSIDFDRIRPEIIVAEYNTHGVGKDYRLLEHLLRTGLYIVAHQTPANLIYLNRHTSQLFKHS